MSLLASLLAGIGGAAAAAVLGLCGFTAASVRRAERLVPPDGQFLDVAGARLHYTDQGKGEAVLLIHGLGGQLRNFARPLVGSLSKNHRVIAVDRPGSGYSIVKGAYPDIPQQAAMIAATIERLDLGRVILVGHSLGGALSLALAVARPELVSSLALVAPLTHYQDEAPGAFRILTIRSALLRWVIGWTIVAPFGRLASKARRGPVFAPDPVPDDFESRGGGALVYRPKGFDAASRDLQGVPSALPALAKHYPHLRHPISILFGRGDRILDPRTHGEAFVARVPHAKLSLVDGGHMLPFTRPTATAAWIEAVIARSGP